MHYLLLLHMTESEADYSPEGMKPWEDYTNALMEAGCFIDAAALHPAATGKIVRVDGGNPVTTDGPYAETKEQLGGYYVIDCETEEEAVQWAARVPSAVRGDPVEVRPVVAFDEQ